mmetsp:Transcript_97908/g.189026  ORF Transcript_97908/g.189026 Transcript_97908/m.189026 type:complete len:238 (+) Transcript_97908:47-760(+)
MVTSLVLSSRLSPPMQEIHIRQTRLCSAFAITSFKCKRICAIGGRLPAFNCHGALSISDVAVSLVRNQNQSSGSSCPRAVVLLLQELSNADQTTWSPSAAIISSVMQLRQRHWNPNLRILRCRTASGFPTIEGTYAMKTSSPGMSGRCVVAWTQSPASGGSPAAALPKSMSIFGRQEWLVKATASARAVPITFENNVPWHAASLAAATGLHSSPSRPALLPSSEPSSLLLSLSSAPR